MSNLEIEELRASTASLVAPLYAACFGEGSTPAEGWGERAACWETGCLEDGKQKIIPYVEVGTPCPQCATPMTEAYPLEWTSRYIKSELSYPGTIALLGYIDRIVAAAWAYEGEIGTIATRKYPNNPSMAAKVVATYGRVWPKESKTFYISEVFVSPDKRGNNYAQELINKMLSQARYPVTSRTLDTSPMTTVFTKAGLKKILSAGSDPENNLRVFYASPRN